MSNKIDWSKAPEWAAKHGLIGMGRQPIWFNKSEYTYVNGQQGGRVFLFDGPGYPIAGVIDVSERPTAPSWSGEGLPPVGVVCGKCYSSPDEYYSVKVLAHDSHYGEVVIYRWVDGPLEGDLCQSTMHLNMASGSNAHWSFRPIRTPEQIADDERERFAQELVAAMGKGGGPNALYQARRMYDLGYRKP